MILRYQEIRRENDELYTMVGDLEKQVATLEAKLKQQEHDYQSLKMARMMEITDGDLEGAKERIARLIREVNKCISLLSDEH